MAIIQNITTIPPAGHRGVDLRDDFVTKQEAFQDALTDTTVDEINQWATEANTLADAVNADQVTVTAKEALVNPHYTAIDAVYANEVNVNKVAVIDTDVTAVAAIDSDVTIAATNVADITNFADVYQGGKATEPSTRNDSSPLQAGDMFFDTTVESMKVYDGAIWKLAGSTVNGTSKRQVYVATADQTVFTVTDNYEAGYADVFVEGIKMVNGVDVDVTNGTTFTLTSGVPAETDVDFVGYGTFLLADHYSKTILDAMFDVKVDSDTTETGTSQIINMVKLTQASYDALTPVATTLYVIVG